METTSGDGSAGGPPAGDNRGRVAVVTGAGSGIGRATAMRLAAEGATVVAVDLTEASLAWSDGVDRVIPLPGSVTDDATNELMVATAVEAGGRLDAVVLNAGVAAQGDIQRGSMDDFDRMLEVNVRAVAVGCKAAVPAMGEGGSIVITGSVSGLLGDSGLFAYNASKGAVVNMARSIALDLAHLGIRVNAVCPGPIRTGMTSQLESHSIGEVMAARVPLGRFGQPEEVAAAICFLTSPASSFVNGVALPVDGGVTAGTGQWPTYGARRAGFA
ncbi:MAG: SDR family oxidoreductase [Actinomycetota bacterium]